MPVCQKCDATFPNTVVIDDKRRWINTRKYCLECSPFNQHNTKKLVPKQETHKCKCGETNPANFYGHKKNTCKPCHNQDVLRRGQEKRDYCIKLLGGKCVVCGYNEYSCSLDIHHTDPSKKSPNYQNMRGWSLEKLNKELESCILLCKNHHQAFHSGYDIGI